MWTGDLHSAYPTQWALNPSAYQNLPNEQVDWATLAQQWIKMKETFHVDQIPPAPPPPSIKADIEAGEAPMDMSKDEVNQNSSTSPSQDGSNWNSWNNWQQWNWNWGGSAGGVGPPSLPPAVDKAAGVPPYTYTPPSSAPSYSTETATTTFDYNHGATVPDNFDQQSYWSSGPGPYVRNKSSEWRGESRGASSRRHSSKIEEAEPDDTTQILDAAKRKQLPAWIREGLEKMEREKQKKIERDRQLKEREEEMYRRKQEEEEALASGIPVKSKFDTDSEESEKESEEVPVKARRSRFDNTTSSPAPAKHAVNNSYSPPPTLKSKSREEIMQDVMHQMRYILTDILMTVTNDEMQKVSEEVLAEFRAKAPATQLRKTPALTSLTGKLGLGIYDSDSEDSSAESDNEPSSKQENGVDSDDELRERINRKKQEFARIERDIEHMVEQQEERDREREQLIHQTEKELPEDKGQVEPKLIQPGGRLDVKTEEPKAIVDTRDLDKSYKAFTPERSYKTEKESSVEPSEESDNHSSSRTESSSSSSSSSRRKKSRKSMKRRKEKKSSKRKRKRSSSRGSDRRKSSHRKSSRRYDERHQSYSRSRSRSHSRSHHDDYYSYHRHSSESSHKRRHRSYSRSRSPDYSRGKKSSHRSRD